MARPLRSTALDGKLPGGEREQIRRHRLRLGERDAGPAAARGGRRLGAVREGRPSFRYVEGQRPPRLQIRLIEAGEGFVRPCRDENRVEEIGVAVERRVAGLEFDGDPVGTGVKRRGGQDDMAVDLTRIDRCAVTLNPQHSSGPIGIEVEAERRPGLAQRERDYLPAGDPRFRVERNRQREIVAKVGDAGCSFLCEGLADPRIGIERRSALSGGGQKEETREEKAPCQHEAFSVLSVATVVSSAARRDSSCRRGGSGRR